MHNDIQEVHVSEKMLYDSHESHPNGKALKHTSSTISIQEIRNSDSSSNISHNVKQSRSRGLTTN